VAGLPYVRRPASRRLYLRRLRQERNEGSIMTELAPNDIVSLNMAYYRQAAGLSQQQLAEKLGWVKQVVSAAERTWEGRRKRNFTADDLAELTAFFHIPVSALFVPPPGVTVSVPVPAAPDPESPVMDAYRKRLAEAGLSGTEVADADELSRQATAFREYCDQWRGELVGMLERLADAARSL
jgi:transcriptional regulator with XRE-family HTH domain